MKIVKLIGGLGNQMFQYALSIALKEHFPKDEILFDCSLFNSLHQHNGLELESVFNIDINKAAFKQLLRVTRPVNNYMLSRAIRILLPARRDECVDHWDNSFNSNIFKPEYSYFDGYWQNHLYFDEYKDEIKRYFKFKDRLNDKTKELLDEIRLKDNTVSLHVRRGDYLYKKIYKGCGDINYYISAVKYILSHIPNPQFYIISDDIIWCKNNLNDYFDKQPVKYIDWNKGIESYQDMLIMSVCKHNIISNSSFSWWGAYLNEHNKNIVCAPKRWNNIYAPDTIQYKTWTQI